jgi:hypothetical protein
MSCQSAVYQWIEVVTTHLPHLSGYVLDSL